MNINEIEDWRKARKKRVDADKSDTGLADGLAAIRQNSVAYSLVKSAWSHIREKNYNEFGLNLKHTIAKTNPDQTYEVIDIIQLFTKKADENPLPESKFKNTIKPKPKAMKPNLKQANARIKAIMQQDGISYKEAQKQYWSAYHNNIGTKVAKLRKQKENEASKQTRSKERQDKAAFRQKCHHITGTTSDGLNIQIRLTQPVKRKTKPSAAQPGKATFN